MEHLIDLPRGSRVRIAEALGITPGAISQWKNVPAEHVLTVEKITGISRHDLRPDVFGLVGQPPHVQAHTHTRGGE